MLGDTGDDVSSFWFPAFHTRLVSSPPACLTPGSHAELQVPTTRDTVDCLSSILYHLRKRAQQHRSPMVLSKDEHDERMRPVHTHWHSEVRHKGAVGSAPVRWNVLWLVLFALVASCSPKPYKPNVDATAIVERNSADAFATFFDVAADANAFRTFDAKVVTAHNRAELTIAWREEPSLAAKGQDFLQQHVFAVAMQERKWPKDAPAETLEPAFVQGVHLGIQDFLNRR